MIINKYLNFTNKINLRILVSHEKIEITLNFTREIPLKILVGFESLGGKQRN